MTIFLSVCFLISSIVVSNQEEVINFLMAYKEQNPAKYELKKAALFKQFGISLEEETKLEPVKDESDIELETLKTKAKAKK